MYATLSLMQDLSLLFDGDEANLHVVYFYIIILCTPIYECHIILILKINISKIGYCLLHLVIY